MHPYTKEGRAATAATEEAAQRQAKTGDAAGEDGDEDDDGDDDVAEVSVWFVCLVAASVVEGVAAVLRRCCRLRLLLLPHPLIS